MMIELLVNGGNVHVAPTAVAMVRADDNLLYYGGTIVQLVTGVEIRCHARPEDVVKQVDEYLLASLRGSGAI